MKVVTAPWPDPGGSAVDLRFSHERCPRRSLEQPELRAAVSKTSPPQIPRVRRGISRIRQRTDTRLVPARREVPLTSRVEVGVQRCAVHNPMDPSRHFGALSSSHPERPSGKGPIMQDHRRPAQPRGRGWRALASAGVGGAVPVRRPNGVPTRVTMRASWCPRNGEFECAVPAGALPSVKSPVVG